MNHLGRDFHQSNAFRFMDILEQESEETGLLQVGNFFLAEDDRSAKSSERVEMAEMVFAKCSQRIRELRARIAYLCVDDPRMAVEKRALENMRDLLMIVQSQRYRLKGLASSDTR